LPSVSDGAMTTLVGELALPGALGSQTHVRGDTAAGHWRVHAADGNRKELHSSCSGRSENPVAAPERVPLNLQVQLIAEALQSNTGSQQRGRRGGQAVVQPLLTVTPFQKATRPRISSAAALGSG
jgi:hypothetical protein